MKARLAPLHAAAAGREDLGHRLQRQRSQRAGFDRGSLERAGPGRQGDLFTCWRSASRSYQAKGLPEVRFPAKDARDFVALAKQQQGGLLYGQVVTWPKFETLENEQATRDNILRGLDWIKSAVKTSSDVAMIFLSGHGMNTPDQNYRYLPYDYDPTQIELTTIADFEFQQYIDKIHGKTLFFFDTCFSGNVLGGKAGTDTTPNVGQIREPTEVGEEQRRRLRLVDRRRAVLAAAQDETPS